MNNKNFLPWLCVGMPVTSCLLLTSIFYIRMRSPLTMAAFIICIVGFVAFWVSFAVGIVRSKKKK